MTAVTAPGSRPGSAAGGAPVRLLATALPVVAAALVWYPIVGNYFYADDFMHLYHIVNWPFLKFVLEPAGGHIWILRNVAFEASHALFGTDPRGYFWLAWATHLVCVGLLVRLVADLARSWWLAAAAALLWGTAPMQEGTLGWYAVYGHALVAVMVLLALDALVRLGRADRPASGARVAWIWGLFFAASITFGVGLPVALLAPVFAFGVLPPGGERRRVVARLATLWIVVPVVYCLYHWTWDRVFMGAAEADVMPIPPGTFASRGTLLAGLIAYGVAGLVPGLSTRQGLGLVLFGGPYLAAGIAVAAYVALLTAAVAMGTAADRRRLGACLVVAVGVYAAVALGRGIIYGRFENGGTLRYHYAATMLVAAAGGLAVGTIVERRPGLAAARGVALAALVALVAAGRAWSGWRIEHHDDCRAETAAVLAAVDEAATVRPAVIQNRPFRCIGLLILPEWFPGWAGVFATFHRGDPTGIRFAESRRDVIDAQRSGLRTADLFVYRPAEPAS